MFHKRLKPALLSLVLLLSISSYSYAFYVIPIPQKIQNVVTVAKSGGNYTDVQSAINSITDASETTPYLVFIGPGTYTVTSAIQMKEFVSINGSGRDITIMKGASSNQDEMVVSGSDNTTLGYLSIINEGGVPANSIGIDNNNASPVIIQVEAVVSGGTNNIAIRNQFSSTPRMRSISAKASGGSTSTGIFNSTYSNPSMRRIFTKGSGASTDNIGIHNTNTSSPDMFDVRANANGGFISAGVVNSNSSSPLMVSVKARGWGASSDGGNRGVWNYNSSEPIIRNSILIGDGNSGLGIHNGHASLSTVIGGCHEDVGEDEATCSLCVNGDGAALDSSCDIIPPP